MNRKLELQGVAPDFQNRLLYNAKKEKKEKEKKVNFVERTDVSIAGR